VPEARKHLDRALQIDSMFALAHYKLAIVSTYDDAARDERMRQGSGISRFGPDPGRARHATAAARLSKDLPDRDKRLISGLLAQVNEDFAGACSAYGALVTADSSDVEALYGVGQCLYSDDIVELVPGDTTHARFRGSWNTALRVLRRTLAIDPTYHLAFAPILAMLTRASRSGCRPPAGSQSCRLGRALMAAATAPDSVAVIRALLVVDYSAPMRRDGDSVLLVPIARTARVSSAAMTDDEGARARALNLEQARVAAQEWVDAGPREARALKTLGDILLRLGRLADADSQFIAAAAAGSNADFDLGAYRIGIALRQGHTGDVPGLIDSLSVAFSPGEVASMRPLLGQFLAFDSAMVAVVVANRAERQRIVEERARQSGRPLPAAAPGDAATVRDTFKPIVDDMRVLLGVASDSATVREVRPVNRMLDSICGGQCPGMSPFGPTLYYGLRLKRSSWPTLPATATDVHIMPAVALSKGDTGALRTAAMALDSAATGALRLGRSDDGSGMIAADAYLLLGDSAAAYGAIGTVLGLMRTSSVDKLAYGASASLSMLWPRAMLLRADLAAARSDRAEAQRWYRAFIDLWAKADPEYQPIVARARAGYQAAGGR